jgi:hypothetical protein
MNVNFYDKLPASCLTVEEQVALEKRWACRKKKRGNGFVRKPTGASGLAEAVWEGSSFLLSFSTHLPPFPQAYFYTLIIDAKGERSNLQKEFYDLYPQILFE